MKLELISSEKYFKTKKTRNIAILLFTSLLLITEGRIFDSYLPFFVTILVILGIYLLISYWYSRNSKKIGYVEINNVEILIETQTYSKKIRMDHIECLKIIQNSYVGEDYKNNTLHNYHGDNWIVIRTNLEENKMEFKIDSHYKNVQLQKLMKELQMSDVKIVYEQI